MATDEVTRERVGCLKSQFNEAIVERTVYKGHLRYLNRTLTRRPEKIRIKNGKKRRKPNCLELSIEEIDETLKLPTSSETWSRMYV